MKREINARQCGILIFLCVLANKFLLLPSLMYEQTGNDAIISLAILFALDFVVLPIFINLKKAYPDEKLFDLLAKKITKPIAVFIYIIFAFYFLIKAILTVDIVYAYLKQQVYQGDFFWIAIISIIPVINHAVMKGMRVMTRTMEIFFILILIGFFTCLGFSLFTSLTFPVFFTAPLSTILTSSYKNAFSFGDFIVCFLIMDKIKLKKGEEKTLYKFTALAIGLIFALFIIYYSRYQITSFMHNNALSDVLVFSIQFNAIGRLDIISMLTIMFITTFELEIFCFGFCDSVLNIFPLMTKSYVIVFFDVLALLAYYLYFGRYEVIISAFSSWLIGFAIFINYIFPAICFLVFIFKGKNSFEKYENNTN